MASPSIECVRRTEYMPAGLSVDVRARPSVYVFVVTEAQPESMRSLRNC
jgi:hypothetical protein